MKRLIATVLLMFAAVVVGFAQVDSTQASALSAKMDEYVESILGEPIAVQCAEVDYMISSSEDMDVRAFVANRLYQSYYKSTVMGVEGVAVHIFDKWLSDKSLKMDEMDYLAARIFVDFNRQSLLGCKAQALSLTDLDGKSMPMSPTTSGRHSVLYFYDTNCSKCALESVLLRGALNDAEFPVDVYCIYVGSDEKAWRSYVSESLSLSSRRMRVWHLWDPEMNYEFHRKYGVIKTPRLFLTDEYGTIIGRSLSSSALKRMLNEMFVAPELDYGSDEAIAFFDTVFSPFKEDGGVVTVSDVKTVADHIESRSLGELSDTTLYRQMTGDLLYYLSVTSGEGFNNAKEDFIDDKILSRSEIWCTEDDSLKVVSLAGFMKSLVVKAPLGEQIPDVVLSGNLHSRWNWLIKPKFRDYALRKFKAEQVILLFYVPGCHECEAEIAAVDTYIKENKKTRILLVNMSETLEADPDMAELFDLSASPYLVAFDKDGVIVRRYFTIANQ